MRGRFENLTIVGKLVLQRIKSLFVLRQVFIIKSIEVMKASFLVEEAIGGVACQSYILLNGMLLVIRQVVVNTVGCSEVILCNDILPRLFRRLVGKVELHDVVIIEFVFDFVRCS